MQALLFSFMFNILGFNTYTNLPSNKEGKVEFDYENAEMKRDCLVDSMLVLAQDCIGIQYKYGGTTTSGFDCSGFVRYIYASFGIELPRVSSSMAELGEEVALDEILPGDLVFFKRNLKSNTVSHVGMVLEKTPKGFKMIHASVSKGIQIDTYSQQYYKSRFLFAKRLDLI
jgi:cell wall-associated NlpC family hydrolase